MNTLESIEDQFSFLYPQIYKTLNADGMLDWKLDITNQNRVKWMSEELPKLNSNPPLLWIAGDRSGIDFEIMSSQEIIENLTEPPDYMDKSFGFVPFGVTGAGDWYAFCYKLQKGDDIPIVLVYHDCDCVTVLAKNFEDFIFRFLLEASIEITNEYEDIEINEQALKTPLQTMLQTHKKYLDKNKIEIVNSIYEKPLAKYTLSTIKHPYQYTGLMSYEELDDILLAEISFDELDAEYPYQIN